MLQQSRPRQVSPLSMQSNDSSFLSRYQTMSPSDNPYEPPMRAPNKSPPLAQHRSGSTTDGHSRSTSSRSPGGSHLSSASSVAHSVEGSGMHSPVFSESSRTFNPRHEDALITHYPVLKNFLASSLGQDATSKTSRARDKLLRLSPTQFLELSTDVYDELRRREEEKRRRGQDVPRYLLPSQSFHPKRNQARQKLSTLPAERFKQLATDVYYELERRVPRLGAINMDRSASPAMSATSGYRGVSRPPQMGMRGPSPAQGGFRGPPPINRGIADRPSFPPRTSSNEYADNNEYNEATAKSFQSNTLVPNKSTMVEDEDSDDDASEVLDNVSRGGPMNGQGTESYNTRDHKGQIDQLQAKLSDLELALRDKDTEVQKLNSAQEEHVRTLNIERSDWATARTTLERQLAELEGSSQNHKTELDRTNKSFSRKEAGLREQMKQATDDLHSQIESLNAENTILQLQGGSNNNDQEQWQEKCQMLQDELATQRRTTEEVRENATHFLQEMRVLSEQSEAASEKEEQLLLQISALESEVQDWKTRYAKAKTELRTLKASSIGLPLQNMASEALAARQHSMSNNGLVQDVDVTNFQMSIDELLQSARRSSGETTLGKMKVVVSHVQHITANGKDDFTGLPSPANSPNLLTPPTNGSPSSSSILKARVARTATGLITATRNYVSADGLSPVSLVDAAAANLTAAVIDYVKTVGIKASSSNDLSHEITYEEDYEVLAPTIHVPQPKSTAQQTQPSAPAGTNAWFNRLKGSFDSSYSNDLAPSSLRDDESEYNSYR